MSITSPPGRGGDLPETDEGSVVSIADKMDTIVGFFGVGLIPTGTADPYALRRQALGVINIILNRRYQLSLDALIGESLAILGPLLKRPPGDVKADVLEFFRGRFENQLISQGYSYDVVDAVLATGIEDLVRAWGQDPGHAGVQIAPRLSALAGAFKRVVNIIRNFEESELDPGLFACTEERDLHEALLKIRQIVMGHIADGEYQVALIALAQLRKPVDAFFEAVLVMAEEEKIRCNRLNLLMEISTLFHDVADFSRIVTEDKDICCC